MDKVEVYAINLLKRYDRRSHIRKEFDNRNEFCLNLVTAIENDCGAVGLWNTIVHIVRNLVSKNDPYIIICEDDHMFTKDYNRKLFFDSIREAEKMRIDVLMGGISWFEDALRISPNLYWVNRFSGLQFTVIFRVFFEIIINADFTAGNAADYKISDLTENKLFLYPFISIQREFGYSDVTIENNKQGRVSEIFDSTADNLNQLNMISAFYNSPF
jgi:glycosyl transferase family 25